MNDAAITVIVSDLHLGGGKDDPGEDHIWQGQPLVRLLRALPDWPDNRGKTLELIFNGDFLEFAQANQAAFSHVSDEFWCTELESLAKLQTIVDGHAEIFDALKAFLAAGHAVTICAGNHDVDLYWPAVQQRLRDRVGAALRFELGDEWISRHAGKLQIGHGHMKDPANRFKHWADPILTLDWGVQRLEMCPGTLFMLKFVNKLEADYPFADNLLPVSKLAWILMREDKPGFGAMAWAMLTFAGDSPLSALKAGHGSGATGRALLDRARDDAAWKQAVDDLLAGLDLQPLLQRWRQAPIDDRTLAATMLGLRGRIDEARWQQLFAPPPGTATLGSDDGVTLGAVIHAGFDKTKLKLREVAQDRVDSTGATVVVMGHTHQPDRFELDGGWYFNPGCWTRYLEADRGDKLTLDQLRDETRFPYQLNLVRVEAKTGGELEARMVTFEEQKRPAI